MNSKVVVLINIKKEITDLCDRIYLTSRAFYSFDISSFNLKEFRKKLFQRLYTENNQLILKTLIQKNIKII